LASEGFVTSRLGARTFVSDHVRAMISANWISSRWHSGRICGAIGHAGP
jgi:hypothetical protein